MDVIHPVTKENFWEAEKQFKQFIRDKLRQQDSLLGLKTSYSLISWLVIRTFQATIVVPGSMLFALLFLSAVGNGLVETMAAMSQFFGEAANPRNALNITVLWAGISIVSFVVLICFKWWRSPLSQALIPYMDGWHAKHNGLWADE